MEINQEFSHAGTPEVGVITATFQGMGKRCISPGGNDLYCFSISEYVPGIVVAVRRKKFLLILV